MCSGTSYIMLLCVPAVTGEDHPHLSGGEGGGGGDSKGGTECCTSLTGCWTAECCCKVCRSSVNSCCV